MIGLSSIPNLGFSELIVLSLVFISITLLAIACWSAIAHKLRLLDIPDSRKIHSSAVPTVGGLAIYIVLLSSLLIFETPPKVGWFIFSIGILVAIGALDDSVGLGVKIRLLAQCIATIAMIFGGKIWIQSLGLSLFGFDQLNDWFGVIITIIAIVGLINAFNMTDGIDGLAGAQLLVGLATISITLFAVNSEVFQFQWIVIFASTVIGFLLVNLSLTPFRKVFLGDAGSMLLGFTLGWALIYYTQEPITLLEPVVALWCVTIPCFDTFSVIVKRFLKRQSPFYSDREHLHHIMLSRGFSSLNTLLLVSIFSLAINLFGVSITYLISPESSFLVYVVTLVCFVYVRNKLPS